MSDFRNKTILVTGATGLIGKEFVDLLMRTGDIKVVAVGRDAKKVESVFAEHVGNPNFLVAALDNDGKPNYKRTVDYIVHCAAVTSSKVFKDNPTGVLFDNIKGCTGILDFAVEKKITRILFLSTVEIYGAPRPKQECFYENDCGVIDLGNPRMAYPESKRVGELLFALRRETDGLDYVVARPPRTFGIPTDKIDRRISSEFIRLAAEGKDIVLTSKGNQKFTFCYNVDMAAALLFLLTKGESGQAYNIASQDSDATVYEFAQICAKVGGVKVIINEGTSDMSHTTYTHAITNTDKIKSLGFWPTYTLQSGVLAAIKCYKGIK